MAIGFVEFLAKTLFIVRILVRDFVLNFYISGKDKQLRKDLGNQEDRTVYQGCVTLASDWISKSQKGGRYISILPPFPLIVFSAKLLHDAFKMLTSKYPI